MENNDQNNEKSQNQGQRTQRDRNRRRGRITLWTKNYRRRNRNKWSKNKTRGNKQSSEKRNKQENWILTNRKVPIMQNQNKTKDKHENR